MMSLLSNISKKEEYISKSKFAANDMASKLGSGPSPLLNQKIDEIAPTTGLTIYTYITHYTLTPYRSE